MAAGLFSKVSVAITASTGGLARGLSRATQLLGKFGRVASAPVRIPIGIGFLAAAKAAELAYRGVQKFGAAVNFAVQQAASLTEQQNRVEKIFGASAASVQQFAKSANAIGLAETQALAAAGTFGTLFDNIGLTEEQSAQMSMTLTSLSSDMASFNEVPVDDALRAMRSALVGEIEPIRRMGIMLNDLTLREKAFAMGLTDTKKRVLTPHQKMMAAYASIVEQAAIQTGDFTDTSGTLSNQQRILLANVRNLAADVGKKLIPVFLAVVSAFNKSFNSIKALIALLGTNVFGPLVSGLGTSISLTDVFTGSIRLAGIAFTIVAGAAQTLFGIIQLGAAVFEALRETVLRSLDGIRESVADVTFVFGAFLTGLEQGIRNVAAVLLIPIQKLMGALANALEFVGQEQFANSIRETIKQMESIADRSSGVGERIQNELSEQIRDGLLGDMAAQAQENARAYGEQAAKNMQAGIDKVLDPSTAFDAAKMKIDMESIANQMIPKIGKAAAKGVGDISEAAEAAAGSLKAIVVDSSAGEEFRNAILRGLDPRTAANTDRQIEENTRRGAAAAEAIPAAFGSILSDQLKLAKVAV